VFPQTFMVCGSGTDEIVSTGSPPTEVGGE